MPARNSRLQPRVISSPLARLVVELHLQQVLQPHLCPRVRCVLGDVRAQGVTSASGGGHNSSRSAREMHHARSVRAPGPRHRR